MTLTEVVTFSKKLSNWIGEKIDGAGLRWDPKIHLSGACFQVGLSHHTAIISLIDTRRYASALALLRPQMECFLRGVWVNKAATQEQLRRFVSGGDLKIGELITAIEDASVFDQGRIQRIKDDVWSDFCDFTHCGGNTIRSHFRNDELTPNFSDDYLTRALISSNAWAIMTGLWIAVLAEDTGLAELFLKKAKAMSSPFD